MSPNTDDTNLTWHKALNKGELDNNEVMQVECGAMVLCITHVDGQYAALDNRCMHQGGPLGQGSIENGLLFCPRHRWAFNPLTGMLAGADIGIDNHPVEVRDDGIYVALPNTMAPNDCQPT